MKLWIKNKCLYAIQALTIIAILITTLRLWQIDLNIPIKYLHDALFFSAMTKALGEGAWAWDIYKLGAPYHLQLIDFAFCQYTDFFILKIFRQLGLSAGMAINVYWLLSIILAGWAATWSLLKLTCGKPAALVAGIIFAITPFVFYRNISHLAYTTYFIPIICLASIKISLNEDKFFSSLEKICILMCFFLLSINNTYYAFFTCLLICFALIWSYIKNRSLTDLRFGLTALAISVTATFLSLLPSIIFWIHKGKGFAMDFKAPNEADIYGLKIRHLLQPIHEHPLRILRAIDNRLTSLNFPLENENLSARLGLIAAIGFLFFLGVSLGLIQKKKNPERNKLYKNIAYLILAIFLFASIGGFGSLFNSFISPVIRCYNRLSIFIAFFALIPIAFLFSDLQKRFENRKAFFLIYIMIICFAAIDQIPAKHFYNHYEQSKQQFEEEADIVNRIEQAHPNEPDMIFQYPFTEYFGDVEDRFRMETYDHARAYLHSNKTHWSWGAVSYRENQWNKRISNLAPENLLENLAIAGFTGIWIDTFGFRAGIDLKNFEDLTKAKPLISTSGRYAYFELRDYAKKIIEKYTPNEYALKKTTLLYPLELNFKQGFHQEEKPAQTSWHWCKKNAQLVIINNAPIEQTAQITFDLHIPVETKGSLKVTIGNEVVTFNASESFAHFNQKLKLPANSEIIISLDFTGSPIFAPQDPRVMYYRIMDTSLTKITE